MEKNSKGFVLTETLIVSAVVITVLIVIFANVRKLSINSNKTFKYNRPNDVMLLESFADYLIQDDVVKNAKFNYADLSDCTSSYLTDKDTCSFLISTSNIEKIIMTKNDLASLKEEVAKETSAYSNDFAQYISSINNEYDTNGYRLVAEFNDGTFANIILNG